MKELKNDPFASIKINEFRSLLSGRFVFVMGLRMMATLVGWWVYSLTNDPFAIGLIGLSEVIPAISLALYAGHVIDLSEKRKLIIRGILLYLLAVLVLIFLSTHFISNHFSNHWDCHLYLHSNFLHRYNQIIFRTGVWSAGCLYSA